MLNTLALLILGGFAMSVFPTHLVAGTVYTCKDQERQIIYTDSPAQLASCQPVRFEGPLSTQGTARDSFSINGATSENSGVSGIPDPLHKVASLIPDTWSPPGESGAEDVPPSEKTDAVLPEFPPGFEDLLEQGILPTEYFPEGYFPPDFSLE